VMGFDEASAYAQLETKLEEAIVAGRFAPGASGWKSRAASLTEATLHEAPQHDGRRNWLEMILAERRRTWVETAHPEGLRRWRATRAAELIRPADPPDDLEPVLGAMRWVLETCRDGVELTPSGYLSPSIVREGVQRFGWWDWPGQPRSEVDVHQLGALRETAARLRLVTKRGHRLSTSRHGVALLEAPSALWRAVATTIAATDDYAAMLSELIAHRLLAGPALGNELEESIVPVVSAQGWRSGGDPVDERHISMSIHRPLYFWRLFGLVEEVRPPWIGGHPSGTNITSLSAAGRATAFEYLRARATAPRRSLQT
jgi:hypothetical protein